MKLSAQRLNEPRHRRFEAILARHLQQLFQCLPMLAGFWMQPDLEVEMTICTGFGRIDERELHDEVMHWLANLADECPEAVQLMCARTFARVIH